MCQQQPHLHVKPRQIAQRQTIRRTILQTKTASSTRQPWKPVNPPQRSKQRSARRQKARLQQVRHRRSRHLKAALKYEESVLQALRPAASTALACAAMGFGAGAVAAASAVLRGVLSKEAGAKERSHRGLENQALELGHKLHLAGRMPALHARQQQAQQAGGVLRQRRRDQLVPQRLWGESRGPLGQGLRCWDSNVEEAAQGGKAGRLAAALGRCTRCQAEVRNRCTMHTVNQAEVRNSSPNLQHDDVARVEVLGRQAKHCRGGRCNKR